MPHPCGGASGAGDGGAGKQGRGRELLAGQEGPGGGLWPGVYCRETGTEGSGRVSTAGTLACCAAARIPRAARATGPWCPEHPFPLAPLPFACAKRPHGCRVPGAGAGCGKGMFPSGEGQWAPRSGVQASLLPCCWGRDTSQAGPGDVLVVAGGGGCGQGGRGGEGRGAGGASAPCGSAGRAGGRGAVSALLWIKAAFAPGPARPAPPPGAPRSEAGRGWPGGN